MTDIEKYYDDWLNASGISEKDFVRVFPFGADVKFAIFPLREDALPLELKQQPNADKRFFAVSVGYEKESNFIPVCRPIILDKFNEEASTDFSLMLCLIASRIDSVDSQLPKFEQRKNKVMDIAKEFIKKNVPLYMK